MFRITFCLFAATIAFAVVGPTAAVITALLTWLSTGWGSEPRIEISVGERH